MAQSRAAERRREQHECLLLARKIEQVKQSAFVECPRGEFLHDQRAGGERPRHAGLVQRVRRNQARPCRSRPDRGEMALARTRRAGEHDGAIGPGGPAVDESERRRIRRPAQEILTREALRVLERQCELTRSAWHQVGFSPE